MAPTLKAFSDSDGTGFLAPASIFVLQHFGSVCDETESTDLFRSYDEAAVKRELDRLQVLEYDAFRAAYVTERDKVAAEVKAMTATDKANLALAHHARNSGKGERAATIVKLAAAGITDWQSLSDPRPYLNQLDAVLALPRPTFINQHTVYSYHEIPIAPSDTCVVDPEQPRGWVRTRREPIRHF